MRGLVSPAESSANSMHEEVDVEVEEGEGPLLSQLNVEISEDDLVPDEGASLYHPLLQVSSEEEAEEEAGDDDEEEEEEEQAVEEPEERDIPPHRELRRRASHEPPIDSSAQTRRRSKEHSETRRLRRETARAAHTQELKDKRKPRRTSLKRGREDAKGKRGGEGPSKRRRVEVEKKVPVKVQDPEKDEQRMAREARERAAREDRLTLLLRLLPENEAAELVGMQSPNDRWHALETRDWGLAQPAESPPTPPLPRPQPPAPFSGLLMGYTVLLSGLRPAAAPRRLQVNLHNFLSRLVRALGGQVAPRPPPPPSAAHQPHRTLCLAAAYLGEGFETVRWLVSAATRTPILHWRWLLHLVRLGHHPDWRPYALPYVVLPGGPVTAPDHTLRDSELPFVSPTRPDYGMRIELHVDQVGGRQRFMSEPTSSHLLTPLGASGAVY